MVSLRICPKVDIRPKKNLKKLTVPLMAVVFSHVIILGFFLYLLFAT